jgi:succinate-semialdehyde dehydrogenase / glutarate-semialdehyde dehydrogenase
MSITTLKMVTAAPEAPVQPEPPSPRVSAECLAALAARVVTAAPREPIEVRAPALGRLLGRVPHCTAEDVELALLRARAIQEDWAQRSFAERAAPLLRFHDLVLERQDEGLDLIQLESGKVRQHGFEEVADVAIVARYYAENVERHLRPRRRQGALPGFTSTSEHFLPCGVVGIIAPWNYPLSMAVTDAIPALLAGNAVVLKPDQKTPFTALWAAALLEEAGLPAGLLQVVTGEGAEIGTPLIQGVGFLTFTGSTETGRKVARQAAERLIGCALELGGKNPMIVLADADLDAAVAGALRGCFSSAGQLCISIERLYVHEQIYPQFVDRFARAARDLRLGFSLEDDAFDVGCLISETQRERVEAHVRDAVDKGATVLAGGRARPDLGPTFFEPTVLADVTPEMTLFAEETFGPVVAVSRFTSIHEAIERANASRYGLNASLWTRDAALARRTANRLRIGTVNVNEAYAAAWGSVDSPMGGFKDSGLGRRHGAEGIRKYTEPQTVAVQRGLQIAAPAGVSHAAFRRTLTGTLKALKRIPLR